MVEGPYTRHPRTTLWLLEEDVFTMGGDDADAQPLFEAEVPPMYIGKSVITNEEYEVFDPSHERSPESGGDNDPVVGVSFRQAVGYCGWYSEATGKDFRLPTELEWEFACRGGISSRWFWGEDVDGAQTYAWCSENSDGRAHEVQTKRANPFGLHDLLGLVWEWTSSLHLPYPIAPDDGRDDLGRTGPRVIRGGSFRAPAATLGSAVREALDEPIRRDDVGFRIVRLLRPRTV